MLGDLVARTDVDVDVDWRVERGRAVDVGADEALGAFAQGSERELSFAPASCGF